MPPQFVGIQHSRGHQIHERERRSGQPGLRSGRRGWNLRRGKDVPGRPSGPLDTLEGRGAGASRLLILRSAKAPRGATSVPVDVQVLGLGSSGGPESRSPPSPAWTHHPKPQALSVNRPETARAAISYLASTSAGAPHSSQSSWMHADIIGGTAEGRSCGCSLSDWICGCSASNSARTSPSSRRSASVRATR